MNQDLRLFAIQWLRVAGMALVPVVLAAFITVPFNLGLHLGGEGAAATSVDRHMT